jgi:phosphatidylglycerol---prolipoprotein diacylglyceryl transferase
MYPVLLSIGPIIISTFGVFLVIAAFVGLLTIWRISRSYELEPDTTLDIAILTFLSGFVFARIGTALMNPEIFYVADRILILNQYPGLSFWGGVLGGLLCLRLFAHKLKTSFWQYADILAVALVIGIVIGDVGCLLGGCGYGVPSKSFFSIPIVGVVGKRFPIQLIDALLMLLLFLQVWKRVIKYHFWGKILGLTLIWIGIIRLLLEHWRGDRIFLVSGFSFGHFFALSSIALGISFFYLRAKRSFRRDVVELLTIPFVSRKRRFVLLVLRKQWYNRLVDWRMRLAHFKRKLATSPKTLQRKLHVKPTPKHFE